MRRACEKCEFWERQKEMLNGNVWGYCRRYPPQVYVDPEMGASWGSPIMYAVEHCGEFRVKGSDDE